LDAAHGKSRSPTRKVQRAHAARAETQIADAAGTSKQRRRRVDVTTHTAVHQVSHRLVAVARSRRKRAITQRNAAEGAEQWFTAIVVASFFGSFEPCGPQPCPAQARKHPAVAGRAPQAASESQALCHSERSGSTNAARAETACGLCRARRRKTNAVQSRIFSLANQRPRTDYASQGRERQTKCSQESVYVYFYTDSSSIFRSPQNDNAVFALNRFRSGTHSGARPGRLRGSRFQREPAPGARSSVSEREQSLRDMLAIIVMLSEADRRTQRVQRPLADYASQGGERQT
jgi:hypothetical protein